MVCLCLTWRSVKCFFPKLMPVVFEAALGCNSIKPPAAACKCRVINPSTVARFSAAFSQNCLSPDPGCNDTEAPSAEFLGTCRCHWLCCPTKEPSAPHNDPVFHPLLGHICTALLLLLYYYSIIPASLLFHNLREGCQNVSDILKHCTAQKLRCIV